jgi:anti-sigma B factor antagonist
MSERRIPEIEVSHEGSTVCISISGDVDADTAPALGLRINDVIAPAWPDVVLDLDQLAFLDSSGLGLLIQLSKRMSDKRAHLSLRNVPAPVRRLLEVTRIDDRFKGDLD